MATKLKIPSASKAKKYFQHKMAFTTGPVGLRALVQAGRAGEHCGCAGGRRLCGGAYSWRTQSAEGPVGQREGREGASPQKTRSTCCTAIHTSSPPGRECSGSDMRARLPRDGTLEGGWRWWQSDGFEIEK